MEGKNGCYPVEEGMKQSAPTLILPHKGGNVKRIKNYLPSSTTSEVSAVRFLPIAFSNAAFEELY